MVIGQIRQDLQDQHDILFACSKGCYSSNTHLSKVSRGGDCYIKIMSILFILSEKLEISLRLNPCIL
jgi:hypothetical protein